ncbi:MAG: Rrf2 family transcriptional regulator, partial [Lachnospiraceae bacterium]|nr:Rrf2 family transcriptional regulator [Lachnospiraceae bacterium]
GHMGGYQLARHPMEITVREILESAEGSLMPGSCMDTSPNLCDRRGECLTLPIYEGLSKVINEYLEGITLQSIIDDPRVVSEYYI